MCLCINKSFLCWQKLLFSFVKVLDSLNLTWIWIGKKLFLLTHMMTESVISSVYPTVVKLLNSAQTPVSLCLVGSGWFSRAGQKADLGKTCGCALSHLLPHACQHYSAPCSNHSAHSLILLGKNHPGVVWQKKRPHLPLQTNVLSSEGRQAVLLLPISVSPCWQVLSVCLKTF